MSDLFGSLYDDDDGDQDVQSNTSLFDTKKRIRQRVIDVSRWRRDDGGFTGLWNQGSTCYLNSLLQTMYMTPEFKASVYGLAPYDLGVRESQVEVSVEVDEGKQKELVDMGFDSRVVVAALIKFPDDDEERLNWILENGENEEAISSVCLVETSVVKKEKKSTKIVKELQKLFCALEWGNNSATGTQDLTESFGWNKSGVQIQHDVHELNRVLFNAIEMSLARTTSPALIDNLYGGELVNQIICQECGYTSERPEHYQDISVPLYEARSLYEALENLTTYEDLNGDNQYACSGCDKKVDAKKGMIVRTLPSLLILSLMRFEFSMTTFSMMKNSNNFPFPLVLDMEPYTEKFRNEGKVNTSPGAFNFDENQNANSDLPNLLLGDTEANSEFVYDLFSVIIHVGKSTGSGHYHAYIRDFYNQGMASPSYSEGLESFGQWYDFNDSTVSPMNTRKLAKQYGGNSECAYMLVYRKRDLVVPTSIESLDHITELVEEHNKKMAQEELEYLDSLNTIELTLYTEKYYNVVGDRLMTAPPEVVETNDDNNSDSEGGFFGMYDSDEDTAPKVKKGDDYTKTIQIDQRNTISDLLNEIENIFGEKLEMEKNEIILSEIEGKDDIIRTMKTLFDGVDTTRTIKECLIEDGAHLLIWNGTTISSVPYQIDNYEITLNLFNFDENHNVTSIKVPESITIESLYTLIQQTLYPSLDVNLYITKMERRGSKLLTLDWTIYESDLNDGDMLSVEKILEESSEFHFYSQVYQYIEEKKKFVSLTILDLYSTSDIDSANVHTVELSRDITVSEVNVLSKSHFNIPETVAVSLKRIYDGKPSSPYSIESLSLGYLGLVDGDCVAIERSEEGLGRVPLTIVIGVEGKRHFGEQQVLADERWTIKQLKETLCEKIDEDSDNTQIFKTDIWDQPSDLLTDEGRSLRRYKIHDGDVLWLTSGRAPYKGQIDITLKLYTILKDTESIYSPLCHLTYKSKIGIKDMDFVLTDLNTFDYSCLKSVDEFKTYLVDTFDEFKGINIDRIRLWHDTKLLREKGSLRKIGINRNTSLTAQILEYLDNETGNLLFVHKRDTPTQTFIKMGEYNFEGASLPELVVALSSLTETPTHTMLVAIYDIKNDRWVIQYDSRKAYDVEKLEEYVSDPETTKKHKNKKLLAHGAIIAVKDLSSDPEDLDQFAATAESLGIDPTTFFVHQSLVIHVETDSSSEE